MVNAKKEGQIEATDAKLVEKMSQGHVIDIMTYNSYSLQYYSFSIRKIGFTRTGSCFLDNANSHQALQFDS